MIVTSPLLKFITAPEARNRSLHISVAEPRAPPSVVTGSIAPAAETAPALVTLSLVVPPTCRSSSKLAALLEVSVTFSFKAVKVTAAFQVADASSTFRSVVMVPLLSVVVLLSVHPANTAVSRADPALSRTLSPLEFVVSRFWKSPAYLALSFTCMFSNGTPKPATPVQLLTNCVTSVCRIVSPAIGLLNAMLAS